MKLEFWYLILGGLLIISALAVSALKRLPLTATMFYLAIGVLLGPIGFGVASFHPILQAEILERASEFAVIVSLFTAGLKLRAHRRDAKWKIPVRLAFTSMSLTVGMVTLVGVWGLGLPLGAAILLGAVLAPTDPVLASEVQLKSATDRDKLRFSLTGEAALNDGTAFPFVMLGIGLLGLHKIGNWGWRWLAIDVLWAVIGGLAVGTLFGFFVGRIVVKLRREHKTGFGREEFLTLGLIGLSYGTALVLHTYGFLAVFAAGLALRRIERNETEETTPNQPEPSPNNASTHLADSVLNFNEQLERILEVALVLVIGIMLTPDFLQLKHIWFVPVILLIIRPIAVYVGLAGLKLSLAQTAVISWFGIRGIGSIYYLAHGIGYGVSDDISRQLISLSLWVIACSIVVHGISVTPLMDWYQSQRRKPRSTG